MLIFIHGPDTYRSRQYLHRLVEKFKADRDPAGYNVVELDASGSLTPGRLLTELLSVPFLAEKRLVVVKNLLSAKASPERTAVFERLTGPGLPESTVAIFWEPVSDFKSKESKTLAELLGKEKFCEEFKELSPRELAGWIEQEIVRREGTCAPGTADFLVAQAGTDLWMLSTVIDQLVAFASDRPITSVDVSLFVAEKVSDNIFDLIEGIIAGNAAQVFKRRQEQYRQGQDSGYILAMLIRQFRILIGIQAALIDRPNAQPADIAKQLKLHPFVVKKSLALVRRSPLSQLKQTYHALLEIDEQTKTGQGDQSVLLDVLISRLSLRQS